MNEKKTFKNLDGAIDYIINQLDDNEKNLIKHGDPIGLHLALDRWIKNEYVFSESTNINELICEKIKEEDPFYIDNPGEQLIIPPDNLSGIIINELIKKSKE